MKKEKSLVKKEYFLIPLLLGVFLFSIYLVSATSSMTAPVNYGNYSSPLTVTVVYDGYNSNNMTNVTCYFNSSGGSSLELPLAILNTTSYQTTFTSTKALTVETRAYNVTCLLQNCSGSDCTTNSTFYATNVTIDNTAPTLTASTDVSRAYQRDNVVLTWSCTDALSGVQTTSVSMTANADAGCTLAGTTSWSTSTGTQTLTGTQTQCAGLYTIASSCTDYSSNSATDSDTFNIYYPEGGAGFIPKDQVINPITNTTTSRKKIILIALGVLIFLILLIVASFLAISKNKKRR